MVSLAGKSRRFLVQGIVNSLYQSLQCIEASTAWYLVWYSHVSPLGPFPELYNPGFSAAIALLHNTTRPGNHEKTMKFSSARRARSIRTNIYMASPVNAEALVVRSDKTRQVISSNPTDSEWFTWFVSGCQAGLGEQVKQDLAMPIGVLLKIQDRLEARWCVANRS